MLLRKIETLGGNEMKEMKLRRPGVAGRLERADRRSAGARERGAQREPCRCASEAFFASIPSLLPCSLLQFLSFALDQSQTLGSDKGSELRCIYIYV